MQSTLLQCIFQSHVIVEKKNNNSVLTPFNSCMCFVAKTAIRASSGLCLEHKHSVGYFAKFLLVIFTKEISHWF